MKDQHLHEAMQLFARKVVEQAQECFEIALDYSEDSLVDVNQILGYVYEAHCKEPLPVNQISDASMIFGAYLGEVFRRNVGGDWVKEDLTGSGEFIIVKMDETILMPIEIVYKVLTEGPGEELNLRVLAFDSKYLPLAN